MGEIRIKKDLGGSKTGTLDVTTSLAHLESKVRFSFKNCDTSKFCIRKLDTNEIKKFYKRLAHFEEMSWQQVRQIPREEGFSVEKKDSSNFSILASDFEEFTSFFHFRVNTSNTPFRVFAAQKEDLCYLLWIDNKGEVNHC